MPTKNILLIVVDGWRGDCLGALGHPCLKTPNLDRLCAEGVTFVRHYAQASPCAPARASLLTGRYLMTHRVVQAGTPWSAHLHGLPHVLATAGYDPAFVGYASAVPDPRTTDRNDPRFHKRGHAVMDGFNIVLTKDPGFEPFLDHLAAQGYDRPGTVLDAWRPRHTTDGRFTPAPSIVAREHSDTAWFVDAGLAYLQSRAGEPWFLHLGTWRPHPPFVAPAPYNTLYNPEAVPPPHRMASPDEEARQHPLHAYYLSRIERRDFFQNGTGLACEMDIDEVKALRAVYYGLLSEIDDHLGRVFDWLQKTGQWQDTLVVFTSDHGEMLGDHHLLGKSAYFDQAFHTPLIIRDPSAAADPTRGSRIDRFTESVDILPTVLDWLGRGDARGYDGRSLLPFCRSEQPAAWRDATLFEYDFRDVVTEDAQRSLGVPMDACALAAIRDDAFKYVHFAGLPPLLFDMRVDPHEMTNLAADPGFRDVRLDYAQRLLSRRLVHADRTLTGFAASRAGLVERLG